MSILDYGCGTGDHVTYPLALTGHQVLGLDIHEPSILEAKRRHRLPNLSFRTGALENLLQEGLRFDAVIGSEVLEHLHDPGSFLVEVACLLHPDGGLVLTVPNGYGSYEVLRRLERALQSIGVHQLLRRIIRRRPVPPPDPGFLNRESVHLQFFRLKTLEALFRNSGYQIVDRRARIFLCGPYVDFLFEILPFRQTLYRVNDRLADLVPLSWAADWMFLLERKDGITG